MVTKDRWDEFKRRCELAAASSDEIGALAEAVDAPLLSPQDDWAHVESFLARVDRVRNQLQLLGSYVEDVKIKHSQLLLAPHQPAQAKDELDLAMGAFEQLSRAVHREIGAIEAEDEAASTESATGRRIRSTQTVGLTQALHSTLHAYNEEQTRYRDRCRQRIQGYLELTGSQLDSADVDEVIESGRLYEMAGALLFEQQNCAAMLLDAESRRDDIRRLERSVKELHGVFLDMALLVEMQGETVDRIEKHVSETVDMTQGARRHVNRARIYRDHYFKRKVCLALLIATLLLFLLVVIIVAIWAYLL